MGTLILERFKWINRKLKETPNDLEKTTSNINYKKQANKTNEKNKHFSKKLVNSIIGQTPVVDVPKLSVTAFSPSAVLQHQSRKSTIQKKLKLSCNLSYSCYPNNSFNKCIKIDSSLIHKHVYIKFI